MQKMNMEVKGIFSRFGLLELVVQIVLCCMDCRCIARCDAVGGTIIASRASVAQKSYLPSQRWSAPGAAWAGRCRCCRCCRGHCGWLFAARTDATNQRQRQHPSRQTACNGMRHSEVDRANSWRQLNVVINVQKYMMEDKISSWIGASSEPGKSSQIVESKRRI